MRRGTASMVKFGVMVKPAPYKQMVEHTALAERLGLDSVWVPDHIVLENYKRICPDAWCILSALATCTDRVTLGTSVTDPYRRHPVVLAQTVATLDHISGGRAILGLGAGDAMNVDPFGIPRDRRITRMRETVEILRRLWTGEVIEYNGKIFKLSKAFIQVLPLQKPRIPLYLAANSLKTRRLVGTHGDGWLAEMMSPERYEADIREVDYAARKTGRSMNDIDVVCVVTTAISEDYDEARETALFYAKRRFLWWPKQLQLYGYKVTDEFDWNYLTVDKDTAKRIREHISEVPDKPCEEVTIFGKPEDCIEKIDKYLKSGVTHFEFEAVSPYEKTCEMLGKKIIPYFKENREC
ncbi:MAG: LLM class flavin-dependent oxidoreductase [Candidatus Bathyarchaeia archaeon]